MGYFKNILVHVDGRNENRDLITCAVALARHHQARVKLVDILPHASWPLKFKSGDTDRFLEQLANAKQDHLRQLAFEFQREATVITYRVLKSPTSIAIIREAIRGQHDLVIKAVKGPESRRTGFFGTTAKRLLRKCPTPVLLVKPGFQGPFRHLVAAVDATSEHEQDTQLNDEIVQMALNLCPDQQLPHLLQVWSLYGESILKEHMRPEELAEALDKTELHAKYCLDGLIDRCHLDAASQPRHLLAGDPVDVIPAFVDEHETDLLVMGTVGRSGVAGLLMGNTAEQILERVSCSVLAVKPPGFTTPIRLEE